MEGGMESSGTNTAPRPGASLTAGAFLTAGGPAGAPDLVTVPTRQGLEAVDIIRRATGHTAPGVGPVLHDGSGDTLGFLVPPGTADAWDLPGSACTHTNGRGMRFGDLIGGDLAVGDPDTVPCGGRGHRLAAAAGGGGAGHRPRRAARRARGGCPADRGGGQLPLRP